MSGDTNMPACARACGASPTGCDVCGRLDFLEDIVGHRPAIGLSRRPKRRLNAVLVVLAGLLLAFAVPATTGSLTRAHAAAGPYALEIRRPVNTCRSVAP